MANKLKYKLKGKLNKELPDQITAEQFNQLKKGGNLVESKGKHKLSIQKSKIKKEKKVFKYNDDPNRKREYEITYQGKIYSINERKGFWSHSKKATHYKRIFAALILEAKIPNFRKIELSLRFNSRHDTVNLAYMRKWFEDTLVALYRIEDDNTNFSGEQINTPDRTLKKNTIVFKIKDIAE